MEMFILDNFNKINEKEKDNINIQMVIFMMVSGKMIFEMVMERCNIKILVYLKVNLKIIKN